MNNMTKEEAIKHLKDMKKGLFLWDMTELIDLCISALSEPEREKGEWRLGGYDDMYYVCSKCDFKASEYYAKPRFKYCPNCGADMRGKFKEGQILTSLAGLKEWSIKEAGQKIKF